MRIILITTDSFPAQIALEPLLKNHIHEIVGVLIVSPLKGTRMAQLRRFAQLMINKTSTKFLLLKFLECYLYPRWARFRSLIESFLLVEIKFELIRFIKRTHTPCLRISDVNSASTKAWVRDKHPELLLSAYGTQILDAEFLNLAPSKVNLHGGLLPEYRGSAPYFWMLANGSNTVGISLHEMSPLVDWGPLFWSEKINILDSLTVFGLHHELSKLAARSLLHWINNLKDGIPHYSCAPLAMGPRFSVPTREQVHKSGVKWFGWSDMARLL